MDQEWLFDYFHTIFRSPQWDAVVMGFIDEQCACFDDEDENKHACFDLHSEFKELVELLVESCLAEVGVSIKGFYDALDSARFARDINTEVFNQLVALDDFITFKKLMVTRNMELELEAEQALSQGYKYEYPAPLSSGGASRDADTDGSASDKENDELCGREDSYYAEEGKEGRERRRNPQYPRTQLVVEKARDEPTDKMERSGDGEAVTSRLPPLRKSGTGKNWSNVKSLDELVAERERRGGGLEESKGADGCHSDKMRLEERAAHLKEMRDRILAKRRGEREKAMEQGVSDLNEAAAHVGGKLPNASASNASSHQKSQRELEADKKRAELKAVLARQMKADLLSGPPGGISAQF